MKEHSKIGPLAKMSSERKKKTGTVLIRIIKAYERVIVPTKDLKSLFQLISKGFAILGMYPYDMKTTLGLCQIPIPEDEINLICNAIPQLSTFMAANGQLTEADLNALMIPTTRLPDRNTKDKNSRAQEQQRAIILTHEAAIKRRQEYLENRDRQGQIKAQDKKEREIKREEKKQKALEDRVAKEKLKKEKEDAKIAAQTEKKARKEEVEKAKEEKKLQSRGESTRAGVENRSKHKKNSQGKQTNSNNNNPLSSSLALNNGNDISLEGSQDVDWIFSMLEPGRGPFSDVATVSSKDVVKDLLAMRRALNPIHISVKNLKDPTFWDEVCYRVNLHNIPLAYIIPGEIQDPFSKLNKKMSDWIDMKTRETKDNKDTSVSIQVPAAKAKFPLPIPPPIAALLNHVTRTQIFAHTESQVLNHDSRVSRGHVDLGFGWLYLIEGVKYIFYVEEPLRTPGSSVHPILGCWGGESWVLGGVGILVHFCLEILGFGGVLGGDREIKRLERVVKGRKVGYIKMVMQNLFPFKGL